MNASRRLFLALAIGVAAWVSVGCSNDVSIVADPAPVTIEATPDPAATVSVSSDSVAAGDVDTPVGDELAADTAPAVVPARSRGQRSASGQNSEAGQNGQTYGSISEVDFMNGFAFDTGLGIGSPVVTVLDGSFKNGEFGNPEYFWFGVTDVDFGDLNGDGVEEAIVATSWNGGGSGYFDSVRAFRLVDGAVESAGVVLFGDRAHGGIFDVRIEEDTSSGFETNGVFRFEAARNQRLTFALTNGPAPADISVTSVKTGQVMSGLAEMVLPADGFYEVIVRFDEQRDEKTTLDVIIDDGESEPLVSWVPVTEQILVTEEPYVTSSLIWPVFTSEEPGTDAANDALARFVNELDDDWTQDVTEFSEPQDDSSYDVSYEVTLATADLVAVRFDFYDYVCCRPYPNYGPASAVLDLTAGRLIPVDEILDMHRIDEINRIWITELEKQGLLPDTAEALLSQSPQFDSLMVRPEGVEFATGRNSLGGGMPGTSTVVSYVQLGDLVNPALVARVARG